MQENKESSNISTSIDTERYEDLVKMFISMKEMSQTKAFHSNFIDFRKTLNFRTILRKNKIDSVLKKCKSKFFRAVQEGVNKLLGIGNKQNRLPQIFITNINIDSNKYYMPKSIREIYLEFGLLKDLERIILKNNLTTESKEMLTILLGLTYREAFSSYVQSFRYQEDFNYIKNREGEKFAILFDYVAKIFLSYYSNSKGNKRKERSGIRREDSRKSSKEEGNVNMGDNLNLNVSINNIKHLDDMIPENGKVNDEAKPKM